MITKQLVETRARSRKNIWQQPRLIMLDKEQSARDELLQDVDILTAKSSYVELDKKQNVLTQGNAGHGIRIDNVTKEDGTLDSIISFSLDERIAVVVPELPEEPAEELKNKMFLVPHKPETETEGAPSEDNVFDEYIWVVENGIGHWEKVGTWHPYIDPEALSKDFQKLWDYIHNYLDVDKDFDLNSNRPLANCVITRKVNEIETTLTWVDIKQLKT